MTAIRELEKARKEIFDRFGVPDIQSVRTRRLVSTISVLRSPLEELTYTLLLRRLRIEAKLSQHQVANKLGVNQSTISKVESGGATSISAERFLEALGLDTDDPKAQLLITKSPQ
ncbi:hypothetical protein A2693_05025 [Candidatus Curtissbacteria bacterium RIFCSPHIGHO2_01_FULL_40_12]|nr:MAG: hypothetical protein A2693_05025 [Candidatus Curtissbacteria bacterium RIFCSPHIGHO2_01_FULL_40_12]